MFLIKKTDSYILFLLSFVSVFLLSASVHAEPTIRLDSSIKIPMHIRVRPVGIFNFVDAQPTVKAKVGGNRHQEKLFFLADTGCTDVMIDTQTAKSLHLDVGTEDCIAIGAHSQFATHEANLPLLSLGPIEEHNLPVRVMDLAKADTIGNTEGILGVSFWKKYVVTFDYNKNMIELNTFCPPPRKKEIWVIPAVNDERGRLYVNGIVDGAHHVRMLVDTCSPTTTMPYQQAKEIYGDKIEEKKFRDDDYDVNGGKAKVATIHTQSFQLANFACTGLVLYVTKNNGQGSDDCIIGDDFLRNFCVSFDFPNHRLILEK